jgi:hypothetical protein
MPTPKKPTTSTTRRKTTTTKKKPATRRTTSSGAKSRLTKADMEALTTLDRLVEEDRRVEQKYNLPFRSPRQVATSFQPCAHCHKDIAWLIFGDFAKDADGLEAYARLMADAIERNNLTTYIIAPPTDPRDLDSPALLLKVHPIQEESGMITPDTWEALIKTLSDAHCRGRGL